MNNKRNIIFVISIILLLIILLIFLVNKFRGTYSIDTDPNVAIKCYPDEENEFYCEIILNTNNKTILGLSANYIKNDAIEYLDFTNTNDCKTTDCFDIINKTENGFVVGNINGIKGDNIIVGSIKVKLDESLIIDNNYNVGLTNISLCDNIYNAISLNNNLVYNLLVNDADISLKSLTISSGTLEPVFSTSKTYYTVLVPYSVSKITVTGETNVNTSTVSGNVVDKELIVGENIINIVVIAQDGVTKKIYTVKVVRENGMNEPLNFDNSLVVNETSKTILRLITNTTYDTLKNKIYTNRENITIKSKDGTILKDNDKVKTGSIVTIQLMDNTLEYTISVLGDINGDGAVNSGDLLRMRQYLLEKINLTGVYKQAGMIESENDIKSLDLLRLRQYLLGEYTFK